MDEAPPRVLLWNRTCGEWPSLTKGGCRFLHQCRSWFLEMVRVWTQQGIRWDVGVKLPTMSRELMHHANFKISPIQISACNFKEATVLPSGLLRPKSLKLKSLDMDPTTVRSFSIGKQCKKLMHEQVPVMLEWARENPTKISDFLRRMGSDIEFQKFYRHLYDPMRHLYRRTFNCEALTVIFMEGVLLKTIKNKFKEKSDCTSRLREELKIRERRMSYLEEMVECGDDTLRARWSEDLPALPEWVIARQKRTKTKPKKRPCSESNPEQERKKVKFSSDIPPQEIETLEPEEEGDVVICVGEDDKEIEVAVHPEDRSHGRLQTIQEELDQDVPMKKKSVPFLKKKGKKKKKASISVIFDYAEAKEAEKQMFSSEDYTLETKFEEYF